MKTVSEEQLLQELAYRFGKDAAIVSRYAGQNPRAGQRAVLLLSMYFGTSPNKKLSRKERDRLAKVAHVGNAVIGRARQLLSFQNRTIIKNVINGKLSISRGIRESRKNQP